MRRLLLSVLALALGALGWLVPCAEAKPPAACTPGRFLLGASALPFDSGGSTYVPLVFSTGSNPKKPGVTLGPCGAGKTKAYKGTANGTKISLLWPTCGTLKKLAVTGTIGNGCKSLQASVKAKKVAKAALTGSLATGCGDGLVDAGAGETCEGTTGCGATEECTSCHCQPLPTTTTTMVTGTTNPDTIPTTTATTTSTTTSTAPPTLCTGGVRNGIVDGIEQCDDGNDVTDDGCTNSCTICGNGTTTAPETCDDGNLTCGDGCNAACQIEACGNGIVDCGETCDDGDLDDDNACPADCVIDPCTPDTASSRQVTVSFAPPGGTSVAALVVLLDYPEGKVNILGSGPGAAPSITVVPAGVSSAVNDLDHKLKVVLTKTTPFTSIAPGGLFHVDFKNCESAPAPTIGEFPCKVVSASGPTGTSVDGVTCTASMP